MSREKILFICTNNSARSQIAEGYLKYKYDEFYDVYSAGREPTTVNPYAIEVMREIGIDISNHFSKSLQEFEGMEFELVITIYGELIMHVHFSLVVKNIYIKVLKTLQQFKEMKMKELRHLEKQEMKLYLG